MDPKPKKAQRKRNKAASRSSTPAPATANANANAGSQDGPSLQPDEMTRLLRENAYLREQLRTTQQSGALLREQLKDNQHLKHMSDCRLAAAQRKVNDLAHELERTQHRLTNSYKTIASFNNQVDMWKKTSKEQRAVSTATQTPHTALFEFILQLQKAHEELEKSTAKLQSGTDNMEEAEQEHDHKLGDLKKGIMDLSVKLHGEQSILFNKAIKMAPGSSEDPCTSSQSLQAAEAERMEEMNHQTQKLQLQLLQQALCLKSGVRSKKAPTKYQWYRTQRDQEQQTDKLDEQPSAEKSPGDQEKTLELEAELDHQKKVNSEVDAALKKAEEQLKVQQTRWQEEKGVYMRSIEALQKKLQDQQQQWLDKECDMNSRIDALESKMTEILQEKPKKKRCWLARHLSCFGSD